LTSEDRARLALGVDTPQKYLDLPTRDRVTRAAAVIRAAEREQMERDAAIVHQVHGGGCACCEDAVEAIRAAFDRGRS